MTQNGITKLSEFVSSPEEHIVRIKACDFKEMLLDNFSQQVNGSTRYFQGVHIGEGVYMVKLLPKGWESGTIKIDEDTDWISQGTKLVLKNKNKNKTQ